MKNQQLNEREAILVKLSEGYVIVHYAPCKRCVIAQPRALKSEGLVLQIQLDYRCYFSSPMH